MKHSTVTTPRTQRGSLSCALADLASGSRPGMPEGANADSRRPFATNLYASRGSAVV